MSSDRSQMTPPDSGERCNATLGEDRLVYQCSRPKGHSGQHRDGNVTAWDQAPDSGEREVPEEKPCEGYGKCAVCDEAAVEITYGLAQRILAALERQVDRRREPMSEWDEMRVVASELRAAVEQKP